MYKRESKTDDIQLRIEAFFLPFGGTLSRSNQWVKLESLIPWEEFEEEYASLFPSSTGAPALSFRIALGTLLVKERMGLSDRATVEYITENPYVQYFLGYSSFLSNKPFDASTITHFRKRITAEMLASINEHIVTQQFLSDDEDSDIDIPSDGGATSEDQDKQPPSGTMILDATCTPADISFPTDVSLLSESREISETLIDTLWKSEPRTEEKPRTYRRKARKQFLAAARKKSLSLSERRKAVRRQLGYLRRNLRTISKLGNITVLTAKQHHQLLVISELYRQQLELFNEKKWSIPDRIVSISQPHIRPIVRGKAGKKVEFGAKVSISLVDGFAFVDRVSFDAYNESEDLKQQAESYKRKFGKYPQRILADQIYRNRENRKFCKENGIQLSGKPLGRPPKNGYPEEEKERWRQDECDRVPVEGKFGQVKRRFSLDRIMAKLAQTTNTVISLGFLIANLEKILKDLLYLLIRKYSLMLQRVF